MKGRFSLALAVFSLCFSILLLAGAQSPAEGREEKRDYLTSNERLKTRAVELYIAGRYREALSEFEALSRQYPKDPAIQRYITSCREELKRVETAQPRPEPKPILVRPEIPPSKSIVISLPQPKRKKWNFNAGGGIEWESNPTYRSRVPAFRREPIVKDWRFNTFLGGSYNVFQKGAWSGTVRYNYSGFFRSNSLSQSNFFFNSWNASLSYRRSLRGRPLIAEFTQTIFHGMRREKFSSAGFFPSVTVSYSFKDWHQTVLSERWGFATFDDDGPSPDHTSLDGFTNEAGIRNFFYFTKAKNFYLLLGFFYGKEFTQGSNNRLDRFSYGSALHFPLLYKVEGEVGFQFADRNYPKWGFPPRTPGRRDAEYRLSAQLKRKLTEHLELNTYYYYANNNSRDDNYTRTNHNLGCSLSCYY